MSIREAATSALKKSLVQRQITCPYSGAVLDLRTAKFILDSDGDPAQAISPEAASIIRRRLTDGVNVLNEGFALEGTSLDPHIRPAKEA